MEATPVEASTNPLCKMFEYSILYSGIHGIYPVEDVNTFRFCFNLFRFPMAFMLVNPRHSFPSNFKLYTGKALSFPFTVLATMRPDDFLMTLIQILSVLIHGYLRLRLFLENISR